MGGEELHEHINGVPNNKVVEYMFGGTCDPSEMEKYSQLKEEYYRQFCKEDQATFHLVKGAEEYFDYLKESNVGNASEFITRTKKNNNKQNKY